MAAIMDLNITYEDLEKSLAGFGTGFADKEVWITEMIEEYSDILAGTVQGEGFDPTEVQYNADPSLIRHRVLFVTCRRIVLLRVRAEILMSLSHELGQLAKEDQRRADELENSIHVRPETMSTEWSGKAQRGSWGFDDNDTRGGLPSPGSTISISRRPLSSLRF